MSVYMMRINFFHSLWRITCFIFLVLVCCVQGYQSAHLHHSHNSDSVAFEVSSPSLDFAVEQSTAHQHHEGKSADEDEHEHKYKKKADWNVARSISIAKVTFDTQGLFSFACTFSLVDFDESTPWIQIPSCKKEPYASFFIIRGPPLLA